VPELPEITAYFEGLERVIFGERVEKIRVRSPASLCTWDYCATRQTGGRCWRIVD
jgi:formamidopyrimidine-DNA glycosylase